MQPRKCSLIIIAAVALTACLSPILSPSQVRAEEGDWEITPQSEKAVELGLAWLAKNQGEAGNWQSKDLGLVALGALAFLSDGHAPGRGKYGESVRRALDYILANAKPSGLLNISSSGRDMYNHGLSLFVLTQAYGLTSDRRMGKVLDRGLKLITDIQSDDGGWDYKAVRQTRGHDLSIAVMQAKALRGATDIGLEIPPQTIELAIQYVRSTYKVMSNNPDNKDYGNHPEAKFPGSFTYSGNKTTTAMAACGAVCLQEFGLYKDFRIHRSMDKVIDDINQRMRVEKGKVPFDAYTMYYVGQGLYQIGGKRWREGYPKIRDAIVKTQTRSKDDSSNGAWDGGRVGGKPGRLFGTAVSVFVLSIPNRYLPILQKGEADPTNTDQAAGAKK